MKVTDSSTMCHSNNNHSKSNVLLFNQSDRHEMNSHSKLEQIFDQVQHC